MLKNVVDFTKNYGGSFSANLLPAWFQDVDNNFILHAALPFLIVEKSESEYDWEYDVDFRITTDSLWVADTIDGCSPRKRSSTAMKPAKPALVVTNCA